MEYQESYSKSELESLLNWFKENRSKFPKSFALNESEQIPDLQKHVDAVIEILETVNGENIVFSGQIHKITELKEFLEKEI